MIGIYQITNKINNKSYIGQSIHIERRWMEHCRPSANSQIAQAIKKFGKDNFEFKILEECSIQELDEKEIYYIQKYNTINPNGYNVAETNSVTHSVYLNIPKNIVLDIIQDLKNTKLSIIALGEKYKVDKSTIYRINKGIIHTQENEIYPIREKLTPKTNFNKCKVCNKPIASKSQYCLEHYKQYLNQKSNIPDRETLKNLIRNTSFVNIGKQFQVTDNAVRKWCDKYNLPRRVSEIKKYTNEEWELI